MSHSLSARRLVALGVLLVVALAAVLVALGAGRSPGGASARVGHLMANPACPRGYLREREPGDGGAAASDAERARENAKGEKAKGKGKRDRGECARIGHPESRAEVLAFNSSRSARLNSPFAQVRPGAEASAAAQAQALRDSSATAAATVGENWTPLGTQPLDAGDATYDQTNGATLEGFKNVSGRVEDFAYDPGHARLYAAPVNGGVWVSGDTGGSWRSIGDTLPTQVVGALGYSTANGGTVLALTGDPAYGGSSSAGLGMYRTTDDGRTWQRSAGIPSGVLGFSVAVDPTNPSRIYAATGAGLFRSTDGGASFTNVMLPTGPCAGHTLDYTQPAYKDCFLANEVTDVVVQGPANAKTPNAQPGAVVAAVGWRAGQKLNADGSQQSPNNGIYTSGSGAPGSFTKVDTSASGFAGGAQGSIGRVALGIANGQASRAGEADQNHNVIYALVEDANKLNGKKQPDTLDNVTVGAPGSTVLLGVYVSTDFGKTWTVMENANGAPPSLFGFDTDQTSGSALEPAGAGLSYQPGVQAWYNEWVNPDPTKADAAGAPTRVTLGLEEIWENDFPSGTGPSTAQTGPSRFRVIGRYWNSCDFLENGLPKCSPSTGPDATTPNTTTTHPDQHAGIYIPDGHGGVTLVAGNDGGVYAQHVAAGADFDNNAWGNGNQGSGPNHLHTLQPYDVEMAKDGTSYMGLQDNGEAKILPDGTQKGIFGGDGFFTAVNPDDPNIAYEEYTYGGMSVTRDGGKTWMNEDPGLTSGMFATPFKMDPTDPNHLVTAGREVKETTKGPDTVTCFDPSCATINNNWDTVFDLGTQQHPGDASATSSATDPNNQTSATEVYGDAAYVGFCGFCDVLTQSVPFHSGIATNVAGPQPQKKDSPQGWHVAAAKGLPNRIVTGIAVDPANPETVFVTLGGYGRKWAPPGAAGDTLAGVGTGHVFRSTDAGQHFTDISGELPDGPANTVLLYGSQVIVGTELGAFISSDRDGSAWAPLGTGLPNVPINHLAFKAGDPKTQTVVAATYGRGAYSLHLAQAGSAGSFGQGSAKACAATTVFRSVRATGRARRLRLGFKAPAKTRVSIDVFQSSSGRQVLGQRLVARFRTRKTAFTWNGKGNVHRRKVSDGYYFVRFSTTRGGKRDVRRITLQRVHGKFRRRAAFYRRASCGLLSSYKLQAPVFGGPRNQAAFASYRLSRPARVRVVVLLGKKVIKRYAVLSRRANVTYRLRLAAERLGRRDYKFRLTATQGRQTVTSTLVTHRL